MVVYLLSFLGLVLLVFCIVDLFHLSKMLKELKDIKFYISELYNFIYYKSQN